MKNLKKLFIWFTCISFWLILILGWSYTYDTATPAGDDDPSEADDRMREIKAAVQERMDVDHVWDLTGTEVSHADTGEHRKVTFNSSIADPTQVASKAHLYMKSDELYYQDDTNTTRKLTDAGTLNIISADLVGTLANDTYFTAVDNAGTGTVDLIKANTSDVAVLPDGSELATSGAPTADADIANKKYVDDSIPALQVQVTDKTDESAIAGTGSWYDINAMTTTQTFSGGKVLVLFEGTYRTANNVETEFAINVDGSRVQQVSNYDGIGATEGRVINMHWLVTGGLSGSKTIKMQWKSESASAQFKSATDDAARTMSVIEF